MTGLIGATILLRAMRDAQMRIARGVPRFLQPGGAADASAAQLVDVAGPLVQYRQDVVGGFRHQADIDARRAEIAEPFQLAPPIVTGSAAGSRSALSAILRKAGRYSSGLPLAAFGYQPSP